jgi:uncharacterized membrane protein
MKFAFLLCHGRSERCLSYSDYEFPLCARCTGIYLGFVTALLIEMINGLPSPNLLPLYIVLGLPAAVDGTTQLIHERESTNLIRIVTGFTGGIGLMLLFRTVKLSAG